MIDLQQFCSDNRPALKKPFSLGGHTYATDGRIAVRMPRMADFPEADTPPKIEKVFSEYFKEMPMGTINVSLPKIEEQKEECRECVGSGYEHECPDCSCECGGCDGEGEVNVEQKVYVQIGTALYNAMFISKLLTLPGVKFPANPPEKDAAPFIFDGGDGMLMPILYGDAFAQTIPATVTV